MAGVRDRLTAVCQKCKCPVAGSRKATIHVSMRDVGHYRAARREWEKRVDEANARDGMPPGLRVVSGDLFLESPLPAQWQIHCDDCNPHKDQHGTMCGGCYWFSLDRCKTHGDLLHWTAHLLGKNWFVDTMWDQLIYALTSQVREP